MAQSSGSSGGIGLAGALFLVFLTLKLAEVGAVAEWSWWWVTSPLWIVGAFFGVILTVVGIVAGIAHIHDKIRYARRRRRNSK